MDALRFVARHADWLMHRPEAEQAYDELSAVVEGARRTIDTRGGQQYAGPCDVCERDMYAASAELNFERAAVLRDSLGAVSYTHLRAHETVLEIVCRLLLEKKKRRLSTFCLGHC